MRSRSSILGWAVALLILPSACGGSAATAQSSPAAAPTPAPVVMTASATVAGKATTILTDAKGMTLYYFTPDKGGKITCSGSCLAAWPPMLLASGTSVPHTADLTGSFTTLANPDGKGTQILYNSWPLYFYVKDTKPGDVTGQNVGGKWFVATPDLAAGS